MFDGKRVKEPVKRCTIAAPLDGAYERKKRIASKEERYAPVGKKDPNVTENDLIQLKCDKINRNNGHANKSRVARAKETMNLHERQGRINCCAESCSSLLLFVSSSSSWRFAVLARILNSKGDPRESHSPGTREERERAAGTWLRVGNGGREAPVTRTRDGDLPRRPTLIQKDAANGHGVVRSDRGVPLAAAANEIIIGGLTVTRRRRRLRGSRDGCSAMVRWRQR